MAPTMIDPRVALDALGSHVAVLDEGGRIIAFNAAWKRLVEEQAWPHPGHGAGERYVDACIAMGADVEATRGASVGVREVLDGHRAEASFELPWRGPAGARWMQARVRSLPAGSGAGCALVVHHEVTQHRAGAQALPEEVVRSARDELLSGMGRVLRAPLDEILRVAELLLEDVHGPLNDDQTASVRRIEDSGRRVLGLIDDILELAKLEAGKVALEIGPVRVDDLCHAGMCAVREAATQKRISTTLRVRDGLAVVLADQRRLEQVLGALLGNAVRFTPAGGEVGLDAAVDEVDGTLRMKVWDTGAGISPQDVPRLFQPFVRLDPSRDEGSGLGLAMVRRIMELHGGSVSVDSEPAKGSRFTVSLPFIRAGGPEPDAPVVAEEPASSAASKGERLVPRLGHGVRRLLLVGGRGASTDDLVDFLVVHGFAVDVVQELEGARVLRPALILVDLKALGVEGGRAALRAARRDPELDRAPIVALAMEADREGCLASGADECLSTTVSPRALAAAIEEILDRPEPG